MHSKYISMELFLSKLMPWIGVFSEIGHVCWCAFSHFPDNQPLATAVPNKSDMFADVHFSHFPHNQPLATAVPNKSDMFADVHFRIFLITSPLRQRSPTLLAPGTGFVADSFSTVGAGGRYGWGSNASDAVRSLACPSPPAVRPGS